MWKQSVPHSRGVNLKLSNTTLCQHWSQYLLHLNRGWCYRISHHLIRQGCGRLLTLMIHLKQEAASIHQSCQVTMATVVKGREGRGGCLWEPASEKDAPEEMPRPSHTQHSCSQRALFSMASVRHLILLLLYCDGMNTGMCMSAF